MTWTIAVTPANVRAAIDLSLDTATLPDATIALAIYAGAAILEVKNRDPLWATRTGDDQAHLNNAADLLTAARVVFAVPAIKSAKWETQGFDRTPIDPQALSDYLIGLAESEIAIVVNQGTVSSTDSRPVIFTLACGRRGA